MFGVGLLSFGVAFAYPSYSEEQLQQQEEQAAASESLTAPVPFVKPDIPKESKRSSFNAILHGKSYNVNSNMAAANNTELLLRYPNLFANRKFFYIEPTNKLGIVSLGSFFTAFDITKASEGDTQLGRLTLGYAAPGFGFYIRAGLGRDRVNNESNASTTVEGVDVQPGVKSRTIGGDDWAFALAKGFLGMNVALEGDWLTTKTKSHSDPDVGLENEDRFDSITVNLNLTNAPTAKNFTWTFGVRFVDYLNETEVDGDVLRAGNPPSYWEVSPYFRSGLSVLENENARILIGAGAIVAYKHYDDPLDKFAITSVIQPSMMGEVFVGENKNFMFYGEVGYDWVAFRYVKDNDADYSKMMDMMDVVKASVGFRYQYKDFLAVELGLAENMNLLRGPGNFFQSGETIANFSAMVRF